MTYDAGSAAAKYTLDVSGFEAGATRVIGLYQQIAAAAAAAGKTPPAPRVPPAPTPSVDPAIRANQRLADSAIRAAAAAKDYDRALVAVQAELNKVSPNTERYNNLLARQATLSRQAAAAARTDPGSPAVLPRTFAGFTGAGAIQAAGAAALLSAAPAVKQYLEDAAELSRVTTRADNSLRALSGTNKLYAEATAAARQQQRLFGGSLAENIDGIQGLVTVSRSSGAELSRLIDLSQRLSIKDPSQGIAGARIALNEALSGDPTSLARRYEIPKAELAKLRDTSTSTTEKLDLLDKYLGRIGITSDVVAGAIPKDTIALNEFNQATERATLAIGGAVSKLQAAAAQAAVTGVSFFGLKVNTDTVTRGVEVAANGVEVYINALQAGKSVNEANTLALAALSQGQVKATADIKEGASAIDQQATAQEQLNAVMADGIVKKQQDAIAAAQQAEIDKELAKVGAEVALGLYDQSDAAAYLAAKYPALAGQIDLIIQQQAALSQGTILATALLREQQKLTLNLAGPVGIGSPGKTGAGDDAIAGVVALQQATKEANKAQQDQAFALANTAGRAAILRSELAKLTPGTAAYIDKQTDLKLAERQLAAEQEAASNKRGKAGSSLAKATATTYDTIENRTEDHYRKLAQLQDDYQLRSARSLEDFNLNSARATEDYEQRRRRLLAEGKIAEANQLKAEFEKDQRRRQEDFQISQSRASQDVNSQIRKENESAGIAVGRIGDRAAIRGIRVAGAGAGSATDRGTLPGLDSAAGAGAGVAGDGSGGIARVSISFAPIALQLDGKTIAEAAYQDIENLLVSGAALVEIASRPKTGAVGAIGGPRP